MTVRRFVPDLHGDPAASRSFYEDVIGPEAAIRSRTNRGAHAGASYAIPTAP